MHEHQSKRHWWFVGFDLHTTDEDGVERIYFGAQSTAVKRQVIDPNEIPKKKSLIDLQRLTGQHYGIPECCIDAYIDDNLAGKARDYALQALEDGWDYVPCDLCLDQNKRIVAHICFPGCGIESIVDPVDPIPLEKRARATHQMEERIRKAKREVNK